MTCLLTNTFWHITLKSVPSKHWATVEITTKLVRLWWQEVAYFAQVGNSYHPSINMSFEVRASMENMSAVDMKVSYTIGKQLSVLLKYLIIGNMCKCKHSKTFSQKLFLTYQTNTVIYTAIYKYSCNSLFLFGGSNLVQSLFWTWHLIRRRPFCILYIKAPGNRTCLVRATIPGNKGLGAFICGSSRLFSVSDFAKHVFHVVVNPYAIIYCGSGARFYQYVLSQHFSYGNCMQTNCYINHLENSQKGDVAK